MVWNGKLMTDSILQNEKECWFCGRTAGLERHHIFAGVANRSISERYGLTVWLCHEHHTGDGGAQYDKERNLQLKREAQRKFEAIYDHDMWMRLIRKNYL